MKIDESNQPELPAGVARLVFDKGRILAQVDPALVAEGLALKVDQALVPFEIVPDETVLDLSYFDQFYPDFEADDLLDMEGGEREMARGRVTLNRLIEWALPGTDTVQVEIHDRDKPQRFRLKAPILLPPHSKPQTFTAELAAHRAAGRLIVRRYAAADRKTPIAHHAISFDDSRPGGVNRANYLHAKWRLAPSERETELRMELVFDRFRPDGSDVPPFLFLSDPMVRPIGQPASKPFDLILEGAHRSGPQSIWLQAALPAFLEPGQTLDLIVGKTSFPLFTGAEQTVSILEDHGHSLQLQASEEGTYNIFIDGKFAFAHVLGRDPTWMRLPEKYQTGEYRHVMITDGSGLQKCLDTYVLMRDLLTPIDVLQRESRAPYPTALMPQTRFRYDALKAQLAAGLDAEMQRQCVHALATLEGGHENVRLEPLHFPKVENPDVSIVIPAHNKVKVTYLALASLLLAHNQARFEVIVVDDASTDETAELERIVSGITVIRNDRPQRFIRACNAGAKAARGRFIALLNNDVEVTNGWLDALLDAFQRFDNVGLVGAKLLYPDGQLQDAGGIIWGSGNPWNYGNRQNPWEPRFCYARQADYLSGAAMMTTREIWDEVGGLSDYLEPMYFEDTDFAFKVREAGYTTWFVPSSIVYHYEGMTSGTDTSSGFKRFQEVNRPKFKRRWASAYSGHGAEGVNPDLEKDRGIIGRVLFMDYTTPRPDHDAGSHAAIQEIRLVQSLGYKVTFLPRNLAHLGQYTEELERMGVEVIYAPFVLSVQEYLDRHARDFDAFYITRYYVAQDMLDHLRRLAPRTPVIFNNADLHFLRELRAAMATGDPDQLAAAREIREQELDIIRKVDVVLSYNEVEHAVIHSHTDGQVKVCKCPWVVEMPEAVAGLAERSGLSFLGNYNHKPNAEGVLWFAREVMPQLETTHPDLCLHIYGAKMGDDIKALESDTIRPEGFIEDIADAYDRHRIFIAPLLSGAGIKGKVLAALAHGVPCVLSPVAAEGTGLRHGHDCLIAETPREWHDAIHALQTDDALWQTVSDNARAFVRDNYGFEKGRALMRAAFETADLYSPAA